MSWTSNGHLLHLESGQDGGTSTSTVLYATSTASVLRLFGLVPGTVTPTLGSDIVGDPPVDCGAIEQGYGDNITYIVSSAGGGSASASDLAFTLDTYATAGGPCMFQTCVPTQKGPVTWEDGTGAWSPQYVSYKDAHVIKLSDSAGWLMVLARYQSDSPLGPGAGTSNPGPENTASAIVAFWAPAWDPTFSGNKVQGPYWLVGRAHEMDGLTVPLWLGVPGAAVVSEGAGDYLFVYYTAEATSYNLSSGESAPPADFVAGTRLRKIAMNTLSDAIGFSWTTERASGTTSISSGLDWAQIEYDKVTASTSLAIATTAGTAAAGRYVAGRMLGWVAMNPPPTAFDLATSALGGVGDAAIGVDTVHVGGALSGLPWVSEDMWDSTTGNWLVPGASIGKVRVWAATGARFETGDDPGADNKGNVQLENQFTHFKQVDAVPVQGSAGLALYFSGNYGQNFGPPEDTPVYGWGIWRASAVAEEATGSYGLDFVVYAQSADVPGERDLVVKSGGEHALYLDPDPVQLPDGSWSVGAGSSDATAPYEHQFLGTDADANSSYLDAWS